LPNEPLKLAVEGLIRSRDAARLLGMSEWLLRKLSERGLLCIICE